MGEWLEDHMDPFWCDKSWTKLWLDIKGYNDFIMALLSQKFGLHACVRSGCWRVINVALVLAGY